jgi:hypothetical protein
VLEANVVVVVAVVDADNRVTAMKEATPRDRERGRKA